MFNDKRCLSEVVHEGRSKGERQNSAAAAAAATETRPGSGAVGRPRVDRDAHERRIESVRGLPVGQPGHGGDPGHPSHELGADGHIEALLRRFPAGSDPGGQSLILGPDCSRGFPVGRRKNSPGSRKVPADGKHAGLCGSSVRLVPLLRLWEALSPPHGGLTWAGSCSRSQVQDG